MELSTVSGLLKGCRMDADWMTVESFSLDKYCSLGYAGVNVSKIQLRLGAIWGILGMPNSHPWRIDFVILKLFSY